MNTGCEIGMVGLGVMGRNLLANMSDHGYSVAGYDKDTNKVRALQAEAGGSDVCAAESIEASSVCCARLAP